MSYFSVVAVNRRCNGLSDGRGSPDAPAEDPEAPEALRRADAEGAATQEEDCHGLLQPHEDDGGGGGRGGGEAAAVPLPGSGGRRRGQEEGVRGEERMLDLLGAMVKGGGGQSKNPSLAASFAD